MAGDSEATVRAHVDVNVFGMLRMVRRVAPLLAKNRGGAIPNVLSVFRWFVYQSRAAAISMILPSR